MSNISPIEQAIATNIVTKMSKTFLQELAKRTVSDKQKLNIPLADDTQEQKFFDQSSTLTEEQQKSILEKEKKKLFSFEEQKQLNSELLSESYFKIVPGKRRPNIPDHLLSTFLFDEELCEKTLPLHLQSKNFVDEHDALADIHSKALAPNINKKLEKEYNSHLAGSKKKKKSLGEGWFGMEEIEMTPEIEQDLEAMRLIHTTRGGQKSTLDSKDVLNLDFNPLEKPWMKEKEKEKEEKRKQILEATKKRRNIGGLEAIQKPKETPKFFQVGTLVGGPTQFFSRRMKRDRKGTLLDEIIHDNKGTNYINEKYQDIEKNLSTESKTKKRRLEKRVRRDD